MARWARRQSVVSVCIPTYNHVDFIADCLNGVLSQRTTFPFEVIVRDDASTDGTQDVLREFQGRYPDILKLQLNTVNEFPHMRPIPDLLDQASADFVALCDGDDYWIRDDKLERQVALLVEDETRSAVAHGCYVRKGHHFLRPSKKTQRREFPRGDMFPVFAMHTHSLMFRRIELSQEVVRRAPHGDVILRSQLCSSGSVLLDSTYIASVYRVHAASLVHSDLEMSGRRTVYSFIAAAEYLASQGDSKGSAQLFAMGIRFAAARYSREYNTSIIGSVRRELGVSFRVGNSMRSTLRKSLRLRQLYFACKRQQDPLLLSE